MDRQEDVLPPEAAAMEVDPVAISDGPAAAPATDAAAMEESKTKSDVEEEEEEVEEGLEELTALLDSVAGLSSDEEKVKALTTQILMEPANHYGPQVTLLKERAIYELVRAYCRLGTYDEVVSLLTGDTCRGFFQHVTKAKCAKVVRAVLDVVSQLAKNQYGMQEDVCRSIIDWCRAEKRTFLRQRVEAKLAAVLLAQQKLGEALGLVDGLLTELKKLDDKQLLVETHLMESKIYHGLRNVAKSKAALTASRTAANAIYVAPPVQVSMDEMSGVLHCEEGDYNTAHSYFLEAFEQLDQMDDAERAVPCLKYMMLCRILDSLVKALQLSAKGGVGAKSDKAEVDISGMISGKQGVKYAGRDVSAMSAIAAAASRRSLEEFERVTKEFQKELQEDTLIRHHLGILHEQLLESNLIRIIEPYSCVEISHISTLIQLPLAVLEKKLSQMILDGKFHGILDQGKGQLLVYEDPQEDLAMERGLRVVESMDKVVSTLFDRSKALRSVMI